MQWQIVYYNSKLENEILQFPDGLLAKYLHLTDLLIEFGSNPWFAAHQKNRKGAFPKNA